MKAPTAKRVRRQHWFDGDVARRLAAASLTRGVTASSIVNEAVVQHLEGTIGTTLQLRRLDRLGRELQRSHRDLSLLSEAFAIWLRLWFAHTPAIPDEAKASARVSAEGRYKQFVDHVADQFGNGKRFLDDLPKEKLCDDLELDEATSPSTDR